MPLAAVLLLLLWATSATAHEYRIDVTADANLRVRGTATLIWHNETGRPVSEIPLRCTGSLGKASIDGRSVRLAGGRVLLPSPIAPLATVALLVEFSEGARAAYGYRMLTGPWHPKAVTWRKGAFNESRSIREAAAPQSEAAERSGRERTDVRRSRRNGGPALQDTGSRAERAGGYRPARRG
jgi:hypothetical protein